MVNRRLAFLFGRSENCMQTLKNKKFHLGIYVVIEKDQKILLVKKTRGPYKGMWDLPGGRIHHGETFFQTLQREVFEETGGILSKAVLFGNESCVVEYQEEEEIISLHHVALIYKATSFDDTSIRYTIHVEDVAECAWVEISEIHNRPISKMIQTVDSSLKLCM